MRELRLRPLPLALALTAVLGLAFQGSRGLWEPDEGRNVNIALGMLSTADWLVPRLNGQPYLDKPPLHYWSVAAGIELLGRNEWGARVPQALFFLGTAALIGALAGRMWGRAEAGLAALVYATTLTPFVAANVLTPDTPLAACTVLLYYAYWRAEETGTGAGAPGRLARWGWWLAAGAAAGLGLLTKGPAILVFLPPLLVHLLLRRRLGAVLREPGVWTAAAVALLLGTAWYGPVLSTLPGASAYLFDNQVVGRLVSAHYERHPGWKGMLEAYLPVLTVGTLPWSPWWCWLALRFSRKPQRKPAEAGLADPGHALVLLWLALPLPVFLFASSRLPLYLLPLFAPFSLATGRVLARAVAGSRRDGTRWRAAVAAWCLLLLGLKGSAAWLGHHRDDRGRALWLRSQVPPEEIVAVDVQLNGLLLYGYPSLLWVTSSPDPYPLFSPLPTLDQAARRLATDNGRSVIVVPRHKVGWTRERLEDAGLSCGEGRPSERLALLLCEPAVQGLPAGGGA
ncbi:MAG TPA: glycosyltransferase family 39 protein [Thermoanaerobaculia bacterium]|nr:glycosyltransferase family 39 protein [Thermoanaerobaculia bacterium]